MAESSLVDAGVLSYYNDNFPADWVMFKMFDLGGGQRVYGDGKIDVGAGEFDWCGAFAKALHSSKAYGIRSGEIVRFDPICVRGAASSAFVFYADAARDVHALLERRAEGFSLALFAQYAHDT